MFRSTALKNYLNDVNDLIDKWSSDEEKTIDHTADHLLQAGGKRIRPMLIFLAADHFGNEIEGVVEVGAAVEMLHMATLIHDDIVDDADQRRGNDSIHSLWGIGPTLLLGDYFFVRSFEKLLEHGSSEIGREASRMSRRMCSGEIGQLMGCFDYRQTEEDYLERIRKKTAYFFEFCCRTGARLAKAQPSEVRALGTYGLNLGLAFQIIDDVLDIEADGHKLGKPVCSDLRSGVVTLPVIHLLGGTTRKRLVKLLDLLARGQMVEEKIDELRRILIAEGGTAYARSLAGDFVDKALSALEGLPQKGGDRQKVTLEKIAGFVTERKR